MPPLFYRLKLWSFLIFFFILKIREVLFASQQHITAGVKDRITLEPTIVIDT